MPVVSDFTALLSDNYWHGSAESGQSVFVTYSFETSAPSYLSSEFSTAAINTWSAFTSAQQAWAETAMAALESVAGVEFLEVDTGGDVTYQWMDFDLVPNNGQFAGFAYYPSLFSNGAEFTDLGGDVFLNSSMSFSADVWLEIVLHELGHAVGLEHPFEGTNTLTTSLDNEQQTVMSYTDVSGYLAHQYGPIDIDALQAIYGTPANFASHLASWSFAASSDTLTQNGGSSGDNILGISTGDVIYGNGGNDTMAGFAGNDFLSGAAGNDLGLGGDGNDQVFLGDGADTANGGDGGDEIGGGNGDDSLEGGDGNDTLYGGAGSDSLFGDAGVDIIWAGEGGDTITEYSNVTSNDTLGGGAGADTIYAGAGNDVAYGGKGTASSNGDYVSGWTGNDTVYAGNGNDTVFGGDGDDLIFTGDGNDSVQGSAGNDEIWGGTGDDTMWGSTGSDIFGFVSGLGNDIIGDFDTSGDLLDLTAYGTTSSQILNNISDFGTTIVINLDNGDSITLSNVSASAFDSSDFIV